MTRSAATSSLYDYGQRHTIMRHMNGRSWWGGFNLERDEALRWRIGPLTLWLRRRPHEWQLAHRRGDGARPDARRPAGGDAARGAVLSERRRRGDGVRELAAVGAYFGGRCLHARGRDAAAVRHLGRPQHARGRALLCERDPLSLVSRRAAVAASSRGDSAALP